MDFVHLKDQLKREAGYKNSSPGQELDAMLGHYINAEYLGLSSEDKWYWWLTSRTIPVSAGTQTIALPKDYAELLSLRNLENRAFAITTTIGQISYKRVLSGMSKQTAAYGPVSPFGYYSTGTISMAQGSSTVTLAAGVWPADVIGKLIVPQNDAESYIITARTDDTTVTVDQARQGTSMVAGAYDLNPAGTRTLRFEPAIPADDTLTLWYFFTPKEMVLDTDVPMIPEEFHRYLIAAARERQLHAEEERDVLGRQTVMESQRILSRMKQRNRSMIQNMGFDVGAFA